MLFVDGDEDEDEDEDGEAHDAVFGVVWSTILIATT
jgi:hypothetical protein